MRKGIEYCQMERSLTQFPTEMRIFWHRVECGCGFAEDFRASSQSSAPRRMIALVAPHTIPTAIIFSIFAPSLKPPSQNSSLHRKLAYSRFNSNYRDNKKSALKQQKSQINKIGPSTQISARNATLKPKKKT